MTPRNNLLKNKLINKILLYSARKNKTKPLALYSVLNPDTSSDSPSAKSKGVRLVSAKAATNHKIEIGISRKTEILLNPNSVVSLKEEFKTTNLKKIIARLTS